MAAARVQPHTVLTAFLTALILFSTCHSYDQPMAQDAYMQAYPKHGKYSIVCDTEGLSDTCRDACLGASDGLIDNPRYKDDLEAVLSGLPADCLYEIDYAFHSVPVMSMARSSGGLRTAFGFDFFAITGLRRIAEVMELYVDVADVQAYEDPKEPWRENYLTLGVGTVFGDEQAFCLRDVTHSLITKYYHQGQTRRCSTDSFEPDQELDVSREGCAPEGFITFHINSYAIPEWLKIRDTLDENVRRRDSYQRATICGFLIDEKLVKPSLVFLRGRARSFQSVGGEKAEIRPSNVRLDLDSCTACLDASLFWCDEPYAVEAASEHFNPSPTAADRLLEHGQFCTRDPLLCAGDIANCDKSDKVIEGTLYAEPEKPEDYN